MSAATVSSKMAAAATALGSGDYATARLRATEALAYAVSLGAKEHGPAKLDQSMTPQAIERFLSRVDRLETAALQTTRSSTAGVMQFQKVNYANPDETS